MIRFSNGYVCKYMVASGALAYDCKGWFWERPLVWLGVIRPTLFAVVTKSLTLEPRKGNLRWWKPWSCVRLIRDGAVNKVGLTNPGIAWWCEKVAPEIDFQKQAVVGSIFGTKDELVKMAETFNVFDVVALEVNVSCPNSGHALDAVELVTESVRAVCEVTRHPVIAKVSADQDYLAIADGLKDVAEAISLNSVPWATVFTSGEQSPLHRLEKKVGGGGGGVSGVPAQKHNWKAVKELSQQRALPVIAPSVMSYKDIARVRKLGADAVSFGAIHLRAPWKPTLFVLWEKLREK